MPKFHEAPKSVRNTSVMVCTESLIAGRYQVQEKLGRGSFGMVYVVLDKKSQKSEELKVLKEISVGDLEPNDTVQANLEAQLLSKLDHPAIVKFYSSFVEQCSFCIITEYCEGGDLQCRIDEYRQRDWTFTENQVIEWFIQLLLGAQYMHERRILHRDLKSSNIFLKNNLVKIGDFGVSRLLMGSCDLATTFTGTPYYMSPEVLSHQGYNSKSDIWSLACILYEVCCLDHAFTGHNFMSVILKIVEGETPSLPDRYSSELNAVMTSMLQKDPAHRPAAVEILKIPYIDQQLQNIKCKFSNITTKDITINSQDEALQIRNALQKKIHLQTLCEQSEVQKMTPRERMRLRKLQSADEKAKKLKQLAEQKYQENHQRRQKLRFRNFQQVSVNVLQECSEINPPHANQTQPVSAEDFRSLGQADARGKVASDRLCMSEPADYEIPEDPATAEEFYHEDGFESCSDETLEMKDSDEDTEFATCRTYEQDTDVDALVRCMEDVLDSRSLDNDTIIPALSQGQTAMNHTMAETRINHLRERATQKLEADVFQRVYNYLKVARRHDIKEAEVKGHLEKLGAKPSDCFEVDQLLYFEEQLQASAARVSTDDGPDQL
ncbi:serine/threonine-protein kinase Nek11 isoform X1 [Chiloscyllium plagiosum]|uniref:serine/threonine-protein kinase Nek11 isoform X1 n=2 Tax=Chiloscyllium plagiosum TaxID=36176 RepID=UPI001CB85AEE|nr:serine/threonine-protein kinase Nek11 isoform X1 [Chiloscyllium plagiosum]XP_043575531.1 serine/threonine-protein kinase Nek11 isoform X1 [Chiloscyllium plagiosum]